GAGAAGDAAGLAVLASAAVSGFSTRLGPAPGPVRFLRTSTCTVLERPCGKLCRTEPVSIGLRISILPPGRPPRLRGRLSSPLSAMLVSNPQIWFPVLSRAEAGKPRRFRKKLLRQPAAQERRVHRHLAGKGPA